MVSVLKNISLPFQIYLNGIKLFSKDAYRFISDLFKMEELEVRAMY